MADTALASTFIIRLVREPAGDVSGVIERVRTGAKERFEGRDALCRLMQEMLKEREET